MMDLTHDLTHALKQANRAAKRGDLAQAERWSKVADRLFSAVDRAAALPAPEPVYDDEAQQAELRRRLALYVEADGNIQNWEAERDLYEASVFAAVANGLEPPPPLRPHPAGPLGEEEYLRAIAMGERDR